MRNKLYGLIAYLIIGATQANALDNLLINSGMEVDTIRNGAIGNAMEGIGKEVTAIDGWRVQYESTATGVTTQRVNDAPPGYTYSLKISIAHGAPVRHGDFFQLYQPVPHVKIEPLKMGTKGAARFSASFWIKSNITGTFAFPINNSQGTRNRTLLFSIEKPDTWQKVVFNDIPGDTSGTWPADGAHVGLFFQICLSTGAKYYAPKINEWQDGDRLMPANVDTERFLSTDGATFYVTGAELTVSAN